MLPRTYAMFRRLVAAARRDRPDVFVAIDFPDFNFRLAAAIRRLGVPIVYYISPQLWAWRPGRMKTMRAARRPRARDFSLRGTDLPGRRRSRAVGRASAPRRHAAAAAEGPARPEPWAVGRGADRRAAAGQPPQRSAGDSARPRGCGKPHPGPAARRAVRRRPRAAHFRRSAGAAGLDCRRAAHRARRAGRRAPADCRRRARRVGDGHRAGRAPRVSDGGGVPLVASHLQARPPVRPRQHLRHGQPGRRRAASFPS